MHLCECVERPARVIVESSFKSQLTKAKDLSQQVTEDHFNDFAHLAVLLSMPAVADRHCLFADDDDEFHASNLCSSFMQHEAPENNLQFPSLPP